MVTVAGCPELEAPERDRPAGNGSETPIGYGLDLLAIHEDQMGKREKMSRRRADPYLARQLSVSRPGGLDPN